MHPGVTVDEVREATGFELDVDADGAYPRPGCPPTEELVLIREVLDPKGLRQGGPAGSDAAARSSTPLTELAGVRHPVVQTGMGWVAGPRLVSGTANAGGLGILASATMTFEELEQAILEVKGRTDQPFGVNLRADAGDAPERVDLLIKHGVKVASFALAPKQELIAKLKDHGIVVMPVVGAARHAEKVAGWGADAVMIQGGEGGGHTGPVPTTLLLPTVLDAVDIPVVAAGGFFDGRGLAAALSYGAAGIGMGTRFLLTKDSRGARTRSSSSTSTPASTAPSSPPRSTACRTGCCARSSSRRSRRPARYAGSGRRCAGPWSSSGERDELAQLAATAAR